MNIRKIVEDYKERINGELECFFISEKEEARDLHTSLVDVIDSIEEYALRGGKKIRPILCIEGYKAAGGKNEDAIIEASTSYELRHLFLLMHDDFMDKSKTRRKKPTIHEIFKEKYKSKHKGDSLSVNLGDITSFLSQKVIAKAKFSPEIKERVFDKYFNASLKTGYGQHLDLIGNTLERDENYIKALHLLKTSAYTFVDPLQGGGIFGRATNNQLEIYEIVGEDIGLGFQGWDDILGIFGKDKLGKPTIDDTREGKITLPYVHAMQNADKNQKKVIEKVHGRNKIDKEAFEEYKQVLIDTGSKAYSENAATQYIESAIQTLEENKKFFTSNLEFLIKYSKSMINRDV